MQQTFVYCLAFLLLWVRVTGAEDADCGVNAEFVVLEIHVGTTPQEIGYQLVCDDHQDVVWNAPVGSLTDPESWIRETVCVAASATCHLDFSGGKNEDGFFVFLREATTVAVSEYGLPLPVFAQYCFGPLCDKLPMERAEDDEGEYVGETPDEVSVSRRPSPNNTPALIGGIVGLIVFCIVLIACIAFMRSRKRSVEIIHDTIEKKETEIEDEA